jgi:hypothetical protein
MTFTFRAHYYGGFPAVLFLLRETLDTREPMLSAYFVCWPSGTKLELY